MATQWSQTGVAWSSPAHSWSGGPYLRPAVVGTFQKEKQYIFIIKTIGGKVIAMTDRWDFDSIIREINGTMAVTIDTDKGIETVDDGTTNVGNQIIIRASSSNTDADGIEYFSGFIAQRNMNFEGDNRKIQIICFGHISKLYQSIWRNGTTISHDYTAGDTVTHILKDIIDNYRAIDSNAQIDYTAGSILDTGVTIKDKFELISHGEALEKVVARVHTSGKIWYWRVLADNVFSFQQATEGPDHTFTFEKDVESIIIGEDLTTAASEAFVYFNNATVKRYSDQTAVGDYGKISSVQRETNVTDGTTSDEIGNAVLESYAPPIKKILMNVNDNYGLGLENVNPGDTCEILNLPTGIESILGNKLFITKITYRKYFMELELSIKHPRIESEVEHIRRRFEQSRTEGIPTTYTDA